MRINSVALLVLLATFTGCVSAGTGISRDKEASAHYKLGFSYMNENAMQPALIEFQKALELTPNDKLIHYAMGHVYFNQERLALSEKAFRKAIEIDPNYSEARNYLGLILRKKGHPDDAVVEFKKALENPFYSTPHMPHYHLGSIFLAQGKLEMAAEEFEASIRLDSSCTELTCVLARNDLGKTFFEMGRIKEAIDAYQEAIRVLPGYAEAHYNLAFAYLKQGTKAKAAGSFRKVIELWPDSERAEESRKFLEALQ